MQSFRVVYLTPQKKKKKKILSATDKKELLGLLKKEGNLILKIENLSSSKESSGSFFNFIQKLNEKNVFGTTVKKVDVILFSRQLGSMIGAGLPLLRALNTLKKDEKNKEFRDAISSIATDVEGGMQLSAALAKFPKIFDSLFVNMIKSAEASGGLDVTLIRISEYIERLEDIKAKIKSATRYPTFVFSMVILSTLVILTFVIPKFKKIYEGMGAKLPTITRIVMGISDTLAHYFIPITLFVIIFIVLSGYLIKNYKKVRFIYHNFLLKIPKIGKIYEMGILVNVTKTFAILISAGIPILDAIELSKDIIKNEVYRASLERIYAKIEGGSPIYNAFLEEGSLYPSILIQMIGTGEETGALDEMLLKFNKFFDNEIEKFVEKISSMLEPILIVFIASIILVITLAIYMPIFSLGKVMMKGH